jgi:chromosome segregation ATPase
MRLSSLAVALLSTGLMVTARAQDSDVAKQLADTQDKLSTALHSYTLLSDENARLKADAERAAATLASVQAQLAAAQRTAESLRALAAASAQLDPLRTQVRQLKDQVADLAQQNYELKNKVALLGSAPSAPSK